MNVNKDILLVAHFCDDFDMIGNNRFNYLAKILSNNQFDVELITSDFSHNRKRKRENYDSKNFNYKVTQIAEVGYQKNISIKRLYSHYMMSVKFKKYLGNRKKPDIIYCSVPSLSMAKVAAKYAKKNNIKFILDVQDLWPEAFKMTLDIPIISDILFYPMKKDANYIYNQADEIIAVSEMYLSRALRNNKKSKLGQSVYLGTDLKNFDDIAKKSMRAVKPENEIWMAYIGTLGHSYDLISVIKALEILKKRGINNIRFIVMGDGPRQSVFEKYAKEANINIQFTGRLNYEKMVEKLVQCDIAVNPIKSGSAASIINKVGDYAAAGLPVINTQENIEYANLLEEYEAGINCICQNPNDISEKIYHLYKNNTLREKMGSNSRLLAEEKFDRGVTYKKIVRILQDN